MYKDNLRDVLPNLNLKIHKSTIEGRSPSSEGAMDGDNVLHSVGIFPIDGSIANSYS